jgi:hypothetical protein
MEDTDGRLFILKGYIPIIEWSNKKLMAMKDEEWEILNRKALGSNTTKLGSISSFQYLERKDKEGFDGCVDQIV